MGLLGLTASIGLATLSNDLRVYSSVVFTYIPDGTDVFGSGDKCFGDDTVSCFEFTSLLSVVLVNYVGSLIPVTIGSGALSFSSMISALGMLTPELSE